jgi:hypothetical protein
MMARLKQPQQDTHQCQNGNSSDDANQVRRGEAVDHEAANNGAIAREGDSSVLAISTIQ